MFPLHEDERFARPYVFINMVASVDGKTAEDGKASSLGTAADRSVMRTLRSKADAVMVGGGTLRSEKLSLGLDADDPRPRPLAVIWTATGNVPLERNLVRDPSQNVLVLLSEDAGEGVERDLRDLARVRRVPAAESLIDAEKALRILKTEYGIKLLLCEGGPSLNHALIRANLADELFVTLAPVLLGGDAPNTPSITKHRPLAGPSQLDLLSAHPVGDELFLRYAIHRRS